MYGEIPFTLRLLTFMLYWYAYGFVSVSNFNVGYKKEFSGKSYLNEGNFRCFARSKVRVTSVSTEFVFDAVVHQGNAHVVCLFPASIVLRFGIRSLPVCKRSGYPLQRVQSPHRRTALEGGFSLRSTSKSRLELRAVMRSMPCAIQPPGPASSYGHN